MRVAFPSDTYIQYNNERGEEGVEVGGSGVENQKAEEEGQIH